MNATLIQGQLSAPALIRDRSESIVDSNGSNLAGRYQILKQLGEGGFAETYLALDTYLPDEYRCVVKKLKMTVGDDGQQRTAKRLFSQEASALHRLGHHSQIPKLLAHFEQEAGCYLIEEFIEGHSLSEELQAGHIWGEWSVLHLLQDLLTILSFVHFHQGGYIHRDIKPSNIIRRHSDNKLVLIDFGSVKPIANHELLSNDAIGQTVIIGTIGYMPSEQLQGKPRRSSDVYAVGMIAIYALTGLNPAFYSFPEDSQTGALKWRDRAIVSTHLAEILDNMISHDLSQRYASAKEALAAIQSLIISHQTTPPTIVKTLSPEGDRVIQEERTHHNPTSTLNTHPTQIPSQKNPTLEAAESSQTDVSIAKLKQWLTQKLEHRTQFILLILVAVCSIAASYHNVLSTCPSTSMCVENYQHIPIDANH